jgi:hypothetical protein
MERKAENNELPDRSQRITEEINYRLKSVISLGVSTSNLFNAPLVAAYEKLPTSENKMERAVRKLERYETATHETGHLLSFMFQEEFPESVRVSPYSKEMTKSLGITYGEVRPKKQPTYMRTIVASCIQGVLGKKPIYLKKKHKRVKTAAFGLNIWLAGDAASYANAQMLERELEYHRNIKMPGTIQADFQATKTFLDELGIPEDMQEGIIKMIFDDLVEFHKDPVVQKITKAIAEYLVEHDKVEGSEKEMKHKINEILKANGITENEWNEAGKKFREIYRKHKKEIRALNILPE